MVYPVKVIGVGPGHPDYLLPIALKQAALCTALTGSARALALFKTAGRPTWVIDGRLTAALSFILEQQKKGPVGVLVSGDPGFYSLLGYLKRYFSLEELEVYPGISSLQLAFARLGLPWQEAALVSLHGRSAADLPAILKEHRLLGLLVDPATDLAELAAMFQECGPWKVYLCRNLSYPDESITLINESRLAGQPALNNTVVVIERDEHEP